MILTTMQLLDRIKQQLTPQHHVYAHKNTAQPLARWIEGMSPETSGVGSLLTVVRAGYPSSDACMSTHSIPELLHFAA